MKRPSYVLVIAVLLGFLNASASASPTVRAARPVFWPSLSLARYAHTPPFPPARRLYVNPRLRHRTIPGWQATATYLPVSAIGAGTPMLLTDGTVLVNDNEAGWYRLTPDPFGSYVNGRWSQAPSLPPGYGPLYFASAVLPDGRLIVEGGEYNFFNPVETNQGAIYDPLANQWTSMSPPSGWSAIGDAQSAVLNDGTFMLGNCCDSVQALLNAATLGWKQTGAGKADPNSEEGWTLLPDGTVLTADVFNAPNSERYNPSTGSWSSAGTIPVNLVAAAEIGPQVLRPDGTVFVAGATGHTAIYNIAKGRWSAGPDFPLVGGQQVDVADGPAALLPDGNVLVAASPGIYHAPASFFEFNGTRFQSAPAPPNAPNDSSYNIRLMVLPNGQVLETDASSDVEIYTPRGSAPKKIAPEIVSVPTTLVHGRSYMVTGKKFNGYSQANMYGDDAQMATNYPLVRITNNSTGHVFYARTHDHSSMAVASPKLVSTHFDVPSTIDTGASNLVVVANGVASAPVNVTIR